MVSEENAEEFDEAMKRLEGVKKELDGFDYHIIYSISKPTKDGEFYDNLAYRISSLTGNSAFSVVKLHIGNLVSQMQNLLLEYQLAPSEPIIKTQPKGEQK